MTPPVPTGPLPLSPGQRRDLAVFTDRLPMAIAHVTPPTRTASLTATLFLLGIGFFGVLGGWAATAAMHSAVVAPGLFKTTADSPVVQHFEGGILREMLVSEGDLVTRGQPLARLEGTRAEATFGILTGQLAGALATLARLDAEEAGHATITPPTELVAMIAADPALAPLLQAQEEVLQSAQRLDAGQVQILIERAGQLQEQSGGIRERIAGHKARLSLLHQDLASLEQLVDQGLATRPRLLALRMDEAAIAADLATAEAQLQSLTQQMAEVEERKLQIRRDRMGAISRAREAANASVHDLRERLVAAGDIRDRLTLRAPVAGRVMGLTLTTPGAVINAGAPLLRIVPENAPMAVEVNVHPNDINEVHEGDEARVRLTAYNYRTTPMVTGHVTRVSPDSFTDPETRQPYFRVQVHLDEAALADLPGVELLLGMPAQVMITTGEQTLADYLLEPVLGGLEVALTESE